jgi:hypothetical protein
LVYPPTFGLDGTGPARPPTLAPAPEGSGIMEETDMVGLPTDTKGLGTDPFQKQSTRYTNCLEGQSITDTKPHSISYCDTTHTLISCSSGFTETKDNFYHCLNFNLLLNTIYILVFNFIITAFTEVK